MKFTHGKRRYDMTVGTKVKQLMGDLTKIQANLESFSIQSQDEKAKQSFSAGAQLTQEVMDALYPRIQEIEQEEPQFKTLS
jgi:hypothetical protein